MSDRQKVVSTRRFPVAWGQDSERPMMRAGTDLLIYRMMWVAEFLTDSRYVRYGAGFYDWAARHGYLRQIYRLQEQALLEKHRDQQMGHLLRLTPKGREKLRVVMDPAPFWERPWSGEWDVILFDIPEAERKIRAILRQNLKDERFGPLQKSVWLRPAGETRLSLEKIEKSTDAGVFQWATATFTSPQQRRIVERVWDWESIHARVSDYREHLRLWNRRAGRMDDHDAHAWFLEEFVRWKAWMNVDPLLPRALWPSAYRGELAWKEKQRAMDLYFKYTLPPE